MPVRDLLKLIYRSAMIAVTLALGIGSFAAYWYATPGNGLLLVSGILAILTLMAGLSISKLDDRDARAATYRGMLDDLGKATNVSVRFVGPGTRDVAPTVPGGMRAIADISESFAEPEVHHVDGAMLDRAKRMASEGAAIDDICRAVDPEHDRHDPMHQEAFRRIVKAMIEQA